MKGKVLLVAALVLAAFATMMPVASFSNFQTQCPKSHTNFDDPIVFPGQQGASHKHLFFGNTTTNYASTYQSMIAGGTTCDETGDTAGYWQPMVIVNGAEMLPKTNGGLRVWYSQPDNCPGFCSTGTPMQVTHTFPKDLRIVAGKASATGVCDNPLFACDAQGNPIAAGNNLRWNCYAAANGQTYNGIPKADCLSGGDGLRLDLWIRFPACWNGVDLDSPNHRDHMAYPTSAGCPASHPVVLPQVTVQVTFPKFDGADFNGYSSGAYYSAHFDFWNTWQQARLTELTGGVPAPEGTPSPPPTPNVAPTAAFTKSCTNLTCSFNASGSTDPDGTIVLYAWTFGDGSTGSGVTPSHCYATAGTYTVILTVTDDDGATDTEQQTVSPGTRHC